MVRRLDEGTWTPDGGPSGLARDPTRRAGPARLLVPVLLGSGVMLWWFPAFRLRAAAEGLLETPVLEAAGVVVAALAGAWAGTRARGGPRQDRTAGILLALSLLLAAGTLALAPAGHVAGLLGETIHLPAVALGFLGGRLLGEPRPLAGTLAPALLGAAAAAAALPWLGAGVGLAGVLAAGALLLLLAALGFERPPGAPLPAADRSARAFATGLAAGLAAGAACAVLADAAWNRVDLLPAHAALLAAPALCAAGVVRWPARRAARSQVPWLVAVPLLALSPPGVRAWLLAAACGGAVGTVPGAGGAQGFVLGALAAFPSSALLLALGAPPALSAALLAAAALSCLRLAAAFAVPLALGLLALVAFCTAVPPGPPSRPFERVLAVAGVSQAVYLERTQALVLRERAQDLDVAGPGHEHAALLAGLAAVLDPLAPRVTVLGSGTGRIAAALHALGCADLRLVDPTAAARSLWPVLAMDGPLPPPPGALRALLAARDRAVAAGSRRYALAQREGGAGPVLVGEPLGARTAARASWQEHAAMRHAAGQAPVLWSFDLDATPPALLEAALAAASTVHAWCGVFLAGDVGVVCGTATAPDFPALARNWAKLPAAGRWLLHAAGLGAGEDLGLGCLGALPEGGAPPDDARLLARAHPLPRARDENLAVLRRAFGGALADGSLAADRLALRGSDERAAARARTRLEQECAEHPDSVLLRADLLRAAVERAVAAIARADPGDPAQVAEAAATAARTRHVGCPAPLLQAALALEDRLGERVRAPAHAGALALALDPGFACDAPPVVAPFVRDLPAQSPLADFAALPPPERLAELAAGDDPLAVALRARFPSRSAAALVTALARGPLPTAALAALRELADPFVLGRAAEALARRDAGRELLAIWRADLPATAALAPLAAGPGAVRQALTVALAGRRDMGSMALLADRLDDPDAEVRAAAAAALFRTVGSRVGYDPEWPQSRRQAAAERLRALHNRGP